MRRQRPCRPRHSSQAGCGKKGGEVTEDAPVRRLYDSVLFMFETGPPPAAAPRPVKPTKAAAHSRYRSSKEIFFQSHIHAPFLAPVQEQLHCFQALRGKRHEGIRSREMPSTFLNKIFSPETTGAVCRGYRESGQGKFTEKRDFSAKF